MKKFICTSVGTLALMAAPALAHDHQEGNRDKAQPTDTEQSMEDDISMLRAAQVFVAIDTSNDAVISKSEWAEWQGRSEDNTRRFEDHDLDGDGDLEFSEYFNAIDQI